MFWLCTKIVAHSVGVWARRFDGVCCVLCVCVCLCVLLLWTFNRCTAHSLAGHFHVSCTHTVIAIECGPCDTRCFRLCRLRIQVDEGKNRQWPLFSTHRLDRRKKNTTWVSNEKSRKIKSNKKQQQQQSAFTTNSHWVVAPAAWAESPCEIWLLKFTYSACWFRLIVGLNGSMSDWLEWIWMRCDA